MTPEQAAAVDRALKDHDAFTADRIAAKRAAVKAAIRRGDVPPCELANYLHFIRRADAALAAFDRASGRRRERVLAVVCLTVLALAVGLLALRFSSIL